MSNPVIQVENLSKYYRLGLVGTTTLKDDLQRFSAKLLGKPDPTLTIDQQRKYKSEGYIWALKDITFEVRQGEILGIIGRNGAGKSTLLKILSRVTAPTSGECRVKGRIASLLEVGTGFHPELTGRENIYLNGAILGMTREEIKRKLDEIVSFAEIEKFIDTPVKRYSSGMYVRLAFAVAAHLEPEILVVDEVLAVGDAAFQKKCLGKMSDVTKQGRTVLFVSHQMNSIRRLCERGLWLDMGRIRMLDSVIRVVSDYETVMLLPDTDNKRLINNKFLAKFMRWQIVEPQHEQPNWLTALGTVTFKTVAKINVPVKRGTHGIALRNSENQLIWAWAVYDLVLEPGFVEFTYTLSGLPIRPGAYYFHVSLYNDSTLLDEWVCSPELIVATDPLTHNRDEWSGILNIPCTFQAHQEKGHQ